MKFKYNNIEDVISISNNEEGIVLLESLYDDIKKPVFIDLINKMSTKLGIFKKGKDGFYIKTEEVCKNLSLLGTLNLE
ncbi:MAG TPA: hypothetical protein VIH28_06865 [Ignavibacteriaceae bacterium]